MSSLLPLKAKAEVRAVTFSPGSLASALMISSAKPSPKYSVLVTAHVGEWEDSDGWNRFQRGRVLVCSHLPERLDVQHGLKAPGGILAQAAGDDPLQLR